MSWGQLTYTSFDPADGGPGGWRVKDTCDLGPGDHDLLKSGVRTDFAPVEVIQAFLTPDQQAALPRRLVYRPGPDRRAVFWHTAAAGLDCTSRPGNLFLHAAVELDPRHRRAAERPIDAWGSGFWLTPWNRHEVLAAQPVSGAAPLPGAGDLRAIAVGHLHACEGAVLATLLDSVLAALAGRARVALVTATAADAAAWISVVSHLLPPELAWALAWSTFERAGSLDRRSTEGLHLVSVPAADLTVLRDRAPGGNWIVVDGQPGALDSSTAAVAGAWAQLAFNVRVAPAESTLRVLATRDAIAEEFRDIDLHPAWALAEAMRGEPDFALHEPLISRVREAYGPRETVVPQQIVPQAQQVVPQPPSGEPPATAGVDDICAALADLEQLCRLIPRSVSAGLELDTAGESRVRAGAEAAVRRAAREATARRIYEAVRLLRLTDFLLRAGARIGADALLVLRDQLRTQAPALLGPLGPEIVRRCGPVSPPTRQELVRALWEAGGRAAAASPELRAWLDIALWPAPSTFSTTTEDTTCRSNP